MPRTGTNRKTQESNAGKQSIVTINVFAKLLEVPVCDVEPESHTELEQIDTTKIWPDGELVNYRIYHIASNMLNATSLGAKVNAEHYITHLWIANAHRQITYVAWVSDVPINLYNQFCRLLGKPQCIKHGKSINQPSL